MIASVIITITICILSLILLRKLRSGQITECTLCLKPIFEKDVLIIDNMPFCSPHADYFQSNKWCLYKSVTSSQDSTQEGVILYEEKLRLLNKQIFSYFKSHYEIKNNLINTKLELYLPCNMLEKADEILKEKPH
jgi:hypothetical protein